MEKLFQITLLQRYVPNFPFGVKIIFGIKETVEGFNLKFSVVNNNMQDIYRENKKMGK